VYRPSEWRLSATKNGADAKDSRRVRVKREKQKRRIMGGTGRGRREWKSAASTFHLVQRLMAYLEALSAGLDLSRLMRKYSAILLIDAIP